MTGGLRATWGSEPDGLPSPRPSNQSSAEVFDQLSGPESRIGRLPYRGSASEASGEVQVGGNHLKDGFAEDDIPPVRDIPGSILCVDDDRNLCQILSEALGGEGYSVRSVFDGDRALAELVEDPPDIVLLDLILPRKDGFAVLEALRAMDAPVCDTPVVLITGCSPTPQNRDRARSLSVVEFLTKPVPLSELLAVVARYAGEQKPERFS